MKLGFPPVAAGVIARRRVAMKILEKFDADSIALKTVTKLRAEFGSGPVELDIPGRTVVVVLDPDDASNILDDTPARFTAANREKRSALAPFQPRGLLISNDRARRSRRPVNEAALETPETLHSMARPFATAIDEEMSSFVVESRRNPEFDAGQFTSVWWCAVRRITLGDAARDDSSLTDALWTLRTAGNWSYFFPNRHRLRDRFFDGLYNYAENVEENSLLAALDSRARGAATDPVGQIPHWLFAFDAAGIATIRAFALLVTHPEQMAEARREIDGADPKSPHPLPFLRSCVLESLRLWPTTPTILRDSVVDTYWGDDRMKIRSGSAFLIYTPAFHRDTHTLDYADSFLPSVWLDGRAESQRGFLPFSSGPAGCPGRNIALFAASTALAQLVAGFGNYRLTSTPQLTPSYPMPATFDHFGLNFSS
ncbi:cytochrome P450 [Rhodococcus sovatensis]|uniref:Cytochrome P450 n=1 Tax=Rhodococcus sovatensis TaxID=1805840 RepID=A0ABZ2PNU4_9NOCA